MMVLKNITSVQNTEVKHLLQLQEKSKFRKKSNTFIIEGLRELTLAYAGGYEVLSVYFDESLIALDALQEIVPDVKSYILLSKDIFQKLAYRDSTEGIIAIAKAKNHALSELKLRKNPLIVVAESIEKPGNIGAILRTCDAAHVDAFLIAAPVTDLYNPNVIRSSVGCVFTNNIGIGSNEEIISFLQKNNINIFSATLQNSNAYHESNFTNGTALVVGTEATGLTEIWRKESNQNINIPMQGTIDSMNVSVAAAILIYEAKRQRNFIL
jgi:TrmH family RNA methyltransferase